MKLSVQINPFKIESENAVRSLPFAVARLAKTKGPAAANGLAIAIGQRVAKQRAAVRRVLDAELPRLRRYLMPGTPREDRLPTPGSRENFSRVTIIRISAGQLDNDGLAGALKHVRDEVASWLGIDDSARSPASWRVGQQKCAQKTYAVRIEIEDDDPDAREVHKIVGATIPKLGPVVGDVAHAPRPGATKVSHGFAEGDLPMRKEEAFAPLTSDARRDVQRYAEGLDERPEVRRRSWDPTNPLDAATIRDAMSESERTAWVGRVNERLAAHRAVQRQEQAPLVFRRSYYAPPGQDESAEEVTLEELTGPLFEQMEPPPIIRKGGRILHRRQDEDPALGAHWIYEPAPSAARAHERAEARPTWTR